MGDELKFNCSLVELWMVCDVHARGYRATLILTKTMAGYLLREQIDTMARVAVLILESVKVLEVKLTEMTPKEKRQIDFGEAEQSGAAERFNGIRHVVTLMSWNGGVG